MQAYLDSVIQPAVAAVSRLEITHLIGCSGTFKTLGRLIAHQADDGLAAQSMHGYRFGPMLFYPVYQRLLTLPLSERLRMKGMQAERAPYMPLWRPPCRTNPTHFPYRHLGRERLCPARRHSLRLHRLY
ncbi:MAG: hypothetical protein KatS3mg026_1327 [Bacteroidia bacterium]|nr:MAG: hypothetical protein KatS3mg026_1327 [Bacteroidia bacterium]